VDSGFFFERNLLALSRSDPSLCGRLSGAQTTLGRYKFLESRSGSPIPAILDSAGAAHPLHSLVDPGKEGRRLVSTLGNEGFIVILGLGGAFHVEAALERPETACVTVIDFDINGVAELLSSRDYIGVLNDPRFRLLVDPGAEALRQHLLERYQPAICGGIAVLPLRTRTDFGQPLFNDAVSRIKSAIDAVSGDYSVQAYFGKRWFSNIIRNLPQAEQILPVLPPIRNAAICAAGPGLDASLPLLREKKDRPFIIAVDTALPSLLGAGLEPDAVVSIDCQHISYYHFMAGLPEHTLLFLDLASPPLVASRSARPYFFSGGHPLTRYLVRRWRPLPELDTSGANVTYAALSLAEYLGARNIGLYGADFSYPGGITYARGSYLRSLFENRQTRNNPLENLHSAFLYRTPLSKQSGEGDSWRYETNAMVMYRKRFEEKARLMAARISAAPGTGAPIALENPGAALGNTAPLRILASGRARMGAVEFLRRYRDGIAALPPLTGPALSYLERISEEERIIFTTLLPSIAAIKRRLPELSIPDAARATRDYSVGAIDRVIGY
jgi:hypothetical protein